MSRRGTSRRSPGSIASVSPDSYHLSSCKVKSVGSSGKEFDITDLVLKVRIIEEMTQPYIDCHIICSDSSNFWNELKLVGSEEVTLKIQRSPIQGSEQDRQKIELSLKVIEIFGYSRQSVTKQGFTIRCGSKHLYKNQSTIINRPFQNTIGKMVKDILKRDLQVPDSQIKKINESTKGIIKGIYPSLRPYYAIKWLLRNAYEDSTPFYFWESAKGGISFDSYKSLWEGEISRTYEYRSFYESQQGTPEYYDEVARRIKYMSSPLNLSQFNQIGKGSYGATLHTFDIAEKKKQKYVYSYKGRGGMYHLNEKAPFSEVETLGDQTYDQLKDSKNYYIPLNSKAFAGHENYMSPLAPTMLKGEAHYYNMDFNHIDITINGDFNLETGMIVQCDISKVGSALENESQRMKDEYFSGKYLVYRIEHLFENKFEQKVTLKRDSSDVEL